MWTHVDTRSFLKIAGFSGCMYEADIRQRLRMNTCVVGPRRSNRSIRTGLAGIEALATRIEFGTLCWLTRLPTV